MLKYIIPSSDDVSLDEQVLPFFYHKRASFIEPLIIAFNVDYGYNFFLNNIIIQHEETDSNGDILELKVDLQRVAQGNRKLFQEGTSADLIGGPAGNGSEYTPAHQPYDDKFLNFSSTAVQVEDVVDIDELFEYKEPLYLTLYWKKKPPLGAMMDILIQGKKIPNNMNNSWGGQ